MTASRHWATTAASALLLLLGLARGAGGVILALRGPSVVGSTRIPPFIAGVLGLDLVFIAALAIVAAFRLFSRRPQALTFVLIVLLAFLAGGALNGYLLFGRPADGGTMVNLAAAAAIGTLAWIGERGR
jgi:hypothetical protein